MSFEPSMDAEGLALFKERLAKSRCYLEYGCGGSTYYAAMEAKVPRIFSVETDREWAMKIRAAVSASETELHLEHCNLGETGEWGTPVNTDRYTDFWTYPTLPWQRAAECNAVPDFVLIDGRFRVACFLYTLLCARAGTVVMFDDYFERDYYFIVERFCDLTGRAGRAGLFVVKKQFDPRLLTLEFARHTMLWA